MKDKDIRHALKNRLTVMKISLELVEIEKLKDLKVKKLLQSVNKEIDKMVKILK
jgi:hypothetical protein